MENLRQVPQAQIELAFVASCIEMTARELNLPYREVYDRMNQVDMIDGYIYPNYPTLHTESREAVAQDLIACLKEREARL